MKAVFLDRDGTLNEEVNYLRSFADFRMISGADEALRILRRLGYRLYVVTNQSGVARGYFTLAEAEALNRRIGAFFAERGAPLDGFALCPHHPEGTVAPFARACDCRKPAPGMLLALAREHGIDLARSFMVGDKPIDAEAGLAAGVKPVLVRSGHKYYLDPGFKAPEFDFLLDFARFLAREESPDFREGS